MANLELKPVEGMVVLRFFDEDPDDDKPESSFGNEAPDDYNKGIKALVVAAGAKVPAKKGQTVFVRSYAKNGADLGDGTVLTDGYCIMAVVEE